MELPIQDEPPMLISYGDLPEYGLRYFIVKENNMFVVTYRSTCIDGRKVLSFPVGCFAKGSELIETVKNIGKNVIFTVKE